METQHTAYRQIMSVFGIDQIPNTGILWNKYGIYPLFEVIRLRVIRNRTHSISSN